MSFETSENLKAEGNDFFKGKRYDEAIKSYTQGLEGLHVKDEVSKGLIVTLYANRAAAYIGSKAWEEALSDCSKALELNPNHDKSIFRRAQASEGKGAILDAFRDLKELVRRDPSNRAAVAAARRCKERLELENKVQQPIEAALGRLNNASAGERSTALKAIIGLTYEDVGASLCAFRLGAIELLWGLKDEKQEEGSLAVKALASLCSHQAVVDLVNAAPERCLISWEGITHLVKGNSGSSQAAIGLALNLLTRGTRTNERPDEGLEDEALSVLEAAVGHPIDHAVRSAGLEAVIQWCSEPTPSWADVSLENGASLTKRREAQASGRLWKNTLSARAAAVCRSPVNLAMFCLLDNKELTLRQQSLTAFGRVMSAVSNDDQLKGLLEPVITSSKGNDLAFLRRKVALTSALFLANGELGVWLFGRDGGVREALALVASGDELSQSLAAELLCLAASHESGRNLLTPAVEAGTLDALLDCPNARARSAAASTIAKLGVATKALKSDSADTGRLLNTAMLLLKGAADDAQDDEDGGGPSAAAKEKFKESSAATTERAIEVLAALITKSAVKDEISHGSGRCAQALSRLSSSSLVKDGRGPAAYGLAHIFASLSVTNKEVQERLLAEKEMEITPEQLAELQRITKQKHDVEDDDDTVEKANFRIRQIVQADGIRALVRLSDGASENTKEQIALALRQIAVEPSIRGSIVQQGGYRVCLDFAACSTTSVKCFRDVTWCVAKTLVTTNPGVLTASQRMGCIAPLLRFINDHRNSDLSHFEALLALTNVASFSDDTKARIASERGIRLIEYQQFSEHEMVRRAATECMTNLMPCQAMIEHLRQSEKLKLWCAFAEDFESDLPTARAAAGTLAMAAGFDDQELGAALIESKALEVMVGLLKSGASELAHRSSVGIGYLTYSGEAVTKLSALGARTALSKISKKKSPEWTNAAVAARQALLALDKALENAPLPPVPEAVG